MRVAHLLRKYDPAEWGGTETAIQRLTAGLAPLGVASTVYAPVLGTPGAGPDPLATAGCAVRRFRACVPVWGLSAEHRRQLVALGGNVISFALFRALWRERKELDVVHSHALGRLGAIGQFIAHRRGLPFVVSVHGGAYDLPIKVRREMVKPSRGGWDWGKPLGLLLGARRLFATADAIITLNAREADLIRARHPDRHVIVQPHGVPAATFAVDHRREAVAAFPEVAGRSVLLVLGRLDATKNQAWLLPEAARIAARHPQVLLVLVGACMDPAYGDALRAQVIQRGLESVVRLAGHLPPGDPRLIGLLQEARAVVLPSVSETFGIVILEAWAAGTPVIASRTSGASALVEDGVNGALFDLAAPVTFHAAVDRVLQDPGRRERWGAAGRAKVLAGHDTAAIAGQMKQIYEQLREGQHAHRHPAR